MDSEWLFFGKQARLHLRLLFCMEAPRCCHSSRFHGHGQGGWLYTEGQRTLGGFLHRKTKAVMDEAIAIAGITTTVHLIDGHESVEAQPATDFSMPKPEMDPTAVIIYTSGTTGSPKGVMLSYLNLMQNIKAVSDHIPIYNEGSRVLVLLPLHHIFPLIGTMVAPLYKGGMLAISPSMLSEDIMKTLQENKVTIIIGVPRLYAAIRKGIMDKVNKSFVARNLFALAKKLIQRPFRKSFWHSTPQTWRGC